MGRTVAELMSANISNAISNVKAWGDIILNVKEYGAVGNGVTDDTSVIQKAIDKAASLGGGTVVFPYMSTEYMISDNLTVPENVRLWGFGSKLKLIDNSNADMIRITGSNVVIDGLELDGNLSNQSSATVRGITGNTGVNNVIVQNCVVRDTVYDGIFVPSNCKNWRVLNNECYSNGRFGIGLGSDCDYALVHGNYVVDSNESGICLVGHGTAVTISNNFTEDTDGDGFAGYNHQNTDLVVTGNTFVNPGNNGTHVGGTKGIIVSNNMIYKPSQYGVSVWNDDNSALAEVVCSGNQIRDPENLHCIYLHAVNGGTVNGNSCSGAVTGQGISLNLSQNVSITGNSLKSCKGTGIRLVNSYENTIVGNNIDACEDGIRLNDSGTGCRYNTILGNKVMDCTGIGILTQNNADYNVILGNIVENNTGGNVTLAGTHNVMDNNILPEGKYSGTATIDPVSLADGEGQTVTITVAGAALGDFVEFAPPYSLQGITATAYVSAASTVSIRLQNETGGTVDLGSGTWKARVKKW